MTNEEIAQAVVSWWYELEQLRAEKEIWLKIVNYDKGRYQRMWSKLTGTSSCYIFPKEDRDHLKNLNELASDK